MGPWCFMSPRPIFAWCFMTPKKDRSQVVLISHGSNGSPRSSPLSCSVLLREGGPNNTCAHPTRSLVLLATFEKALLCYTACVLSKKIWMNFNPKLVVGSKSSGLIKTSLQYISQNAKTFPNMSGHELSKNLPAFSRPPKYTAHQILWSHDSDSRAHPSKPM